MRASEARLASGTVWCVVRPAADAATATVAIPSTTNRHRRARPRLREQQKQQSLSQPLSRRVSEYWTGGIDRNPRSLSLYLSRCFFPRPTEKPTCLSMCSNVTRLLHYEPVSRPLLSRMSPGEAARRTLPQP